MLTGLRKVVKNVFQPQAPICLGCLRVRDDEAYWQHVEGRGKRSLLADLCPNCYRTLDRAA